MAMKQQQQQQQQPHQQQTSSSRTRAAETMMMMTVGTTTTEITMMEPLAVSDLSSAAESMIASSTTIGGGELVGTSSSSSSSSVEFEAMLPDSTTLLGFSLIVLFSALAVYVWANQVVPVSRTNLAISKRSGAVKEYLDELEEAAAVTETSSLEKGEHRVIDVGDVQTQTSNVAKDKNGGASQAADTDTDSDAALATGISAVTTASKSSSSSSSRKLERWIFTDWLQQARQRSSTTTKKAGRRQKEPAIPILKDEKWNSGDNPVLVASALIGVGVLLTAIIERISQIISV